MPTVDTVNRPELITLMATRSGHPKGVVDDVLRALTDELLHQMAGGRGVNLHGIARFAPVRQRQQLARNPGTGEPVLVSVRTRPWNRSGAVQTRVTARDEEPPRSAAQMAKMRNKVTRAALPKSR